MKKWLLSSAILATFALFSACGDDSSSGPEEESSSSIEAESSSSNVIASSSSAKQSSSSEAESSSSIAEESSSSNVIASSSGAKQSSSSEEESSSSEAVAEVMPSGTYDCGTYNCVDTTYLKAGIIYGEILDTRDNQVYKVVTIGEGDDAQTWMAQNLNYEVPLSYCYDKYSGNCLNQGGRLYTWEVAMYKAGCGYRNYCSNSNEGTQGVCPEGWHLPSNAEWATLFTNVGGINTAGTELKSSQTDFLSWNGRNRGDSYGFSAVPAGIRLFNGNFRELGTRAYFWSSSELDEYSAYHMRLDDGESANLLGNDSKDYAFSVRCIKD